MTTQLSPSPTTLSSTRSCRFGVGWYALTETQLSELPEQDRTNSVRVFGGSAPVLFDTPGEAQWFLDQICTVNGEKKIKELTPHGSPGLFVCCLEISDDKKRFVKYTAPNRAHIIPQEPILLHK